MFRDDRAGESIAEDIRRFVKWCGCVVIIRYEKSEDVTNRFVQACSPINGDLILRRWDGLLRLIWERGLRFIIIEESGDDSLDRSERIRI